MCNTKQSLAAQLDWRTTFEKVGCGSASHLHAVQSIECPLCADGTLSAMEDHVLRAKWFNCRECEFAGDLIELVACHLGVEIEEAISTLDALHLFKSTVDDDRVAAYMDQHVRYRRRIQQFWEEARNRPLYAITNPGIQLLKKCSLGSNVLQPIWADGEAQLFGVAEAKRVEELFAPLSYEPRMRANRSGRSSRRRGSGPGAGRLFCGNSWDEVVVIPHYDLPGRIIGFLLIGRDADPAAGDVIYKRANIGCTNQRPKESGFAMLPSVRRELLRSFGNTVFVFTDVFPAMYLQAENFREATVPLPVVALHETTDLKSLHLPSNLEDRRLIFCGPLHTTLPLARRYHGLVSEYAIPKADIETRLNRRRPGEFLRLLQRKACPWHPLMLRLLPTLSIEEGRLLVDRLNLSPTECRQILASSKEPHRFEALSPLRVGAKKVVIGRQTVVERAEGWFIENTNERICNYPLRIDVIRTTDLGDTQYEVTVHCSERPVTLQVKLQDVHNGNLFAAVNQGLLKAQGEPLNYQQRKWARQSLFIALELSEPETIQSAGRIGWTNDGLRFQFPRFALFHNGEFNRDPMPIELKNVPRPACDLSPPRTDPNCVAQLSEESTENGIVWGIAAGMIQHLTLNRCHGQPPIGMVLDGLYAHETGANAALALGCGTAHLADRGDQRIREYISDQCSVHDFPVVIVSGQNSRMSLLASWLDDPNFRRAIMPLNPYAAISVASRPGFVRIFHCGPPQSLGASASAARWIIPNYLCDVLKRRLYYQLDGNDQLLWTILDDMAEWFGQQGGNPQALTKARDLLHFDGADLPRAFVETVVRLHEGGVITCVHAGAESTVPAKTPVAVVFDYEHDGLVRVRPSIINDALHCKRAPAVALDQILSRLDGQGVLRGRQGEEWLIDQEWWNSVVQFIAGGQPELTASSTGSGRSMGGI